MGELDEDYVSVLLLSNLGPNGNNNLLRMAKKSTKKVSKRGRSAKTGRFITIANALKDRATSVIERIKSAFSRK